MFNGLFIPLIFWVIFLGSFSQARPISIHWLGADNWQADVDTTSPHITPSGQHVGFQSSVLNNDNATSQGTNYLNVFVYSRSNDLLAQITKATDGNSLIGGLSADGNLVVFASSDSQLLTKSGFANNNGDYQIYLYNINLNKLTLVSQHSGLLGNASSYRPKISSNGRYVTFLSNSDNLASNVGLATQAYLYEVATGGIRLVSQFENKPSELAVSEVAISAQGDVVFITSASNLGYSNPLKIAQVYLYTQAGKLSLISKASDDSIANQISEELNISDDGNVITFTSSASNLGNSVPRTSQVYIYQTQNASLEVVSLANNGQIANSDSAFSSLSADGRFVSFQSYADNLVDEKNNSETNIYLRDRVLNTTILASTRLDGKTDLNGFDISGDSDISTVTNLLGNGHVQVAFASHAVLTNDNFNALKDIYIADIDLAKPLGDPNNTSGLNPDGSPGGLLEGSTGGLDLLSITVPTNGQPVSGYSQPLSEVTIAVDLLDSNSPSCQTTTNNLGQYSCLLFPKLTANNQTGTLSARAVNAQGESLEITVKNAIDLLAPKPPLLPSRSDGNPLIGKSEPETKVDVKVINSTGQIVTQCIAKTDSHGNFSCQLDQTLLVNGLSLRATASDLAGNVSKEARADNAIVVNSNIGLSIITPSDGLPIIGQATAGDIITISTPYGANCQTTATQSGSFSCDMQPEPNKISDVIAKINGAQGAGSEITVIDGIIPSRVVLDSCRLMLYEFKDSSQYQLPNATLLSKAIKFNGELCQGTGTQATVRFDELSSINKPDDLRIYKLYSNKPALDITNSVKWDMTAKTVSYTVIDGGELDSDGKVNAKITDPIILAKKISNKVAPIPGLSSPILLLLVFVISSFALFSFRRRFSSDRLRRLPHLVLLLLSFIIFPSDVLAQSIAHNANTRNFSAEFRANEMGGAEIIIPIDVPVGAGGINPGLSFGYNSSAGNGLMGLGWSVAGMSAISRCRQNLLHEGTTQPIKYNNEDRFCLDGARLIPVSGTNGADGTAYKVEVDNYRRTHSYGTNGYPDYFVIESKDGTKRYYGLAGEVSAERSLNGVSYSWSLAKMTDNMGNEIDYHYNNRGYISDIRYNFKSKSGDTTPGAVIRFIYEDRPDAQTYYLNGGAKEELTGRLRQINIYKAATTSIDYPNIPDNYPNAPHTPSSPNNPNSEPEYPEPPVAGAINPDYPTGIPPLVNGTPPSVSPGNPSTIDGYPDVDGANINLEPNYPSLVDGALSLGRYPSVDGAIVPELDPCHYGFCEGQIETDYLKTQLVLVRQYNIYYSWEHIPQSLPLSSKAKDNKDTANKEVNKNNPSNPDFPYGNNIASKVIFIDECNAQANCTRLNFDWERQENYFTQEKHQQFSKYAMGSQYGDINGDGITDMVWIQVRGDGDTDVKIALGLGDDNKTHIFQDSSLLAEGLRVRAKYDLTSWTLFDFTGDGQDDLLSTGYFGWQVRSAVESKPGFYRFKSQDEEDLRANIFSGENSDDGKFVTGVMDLTGDGLPDIFKIEPKDGEIKLFVYPMYPAAHFGNDPSWPYPYRFSRHQLAKPIVYTIPDLVSSGYYQLVRSGIGDYNGDAIPDLVFNLWDKAAGEDCDKINSGTWPGANYCRATNHQADDFPKGKNYNYKKSVVYTVPLGGGRLNKWGEHIATVSGGPITKTDDTRKQSLIDAVQVDINNDGLADLLQGDGVYLNNGLKLDKVHSIAHLNFASGNMFTIDYDLDGDLDLLVNDRDRKLQLYTNNNGQFVYNQDTPIDYRGKSTYTTIQTDLNGDGNNDFTQSHFRHKSRHNWVRSYKPGYDGKFVNQIKRIRDSYGSVTEILYKPLPDKSAYESQSNANAVASLTPRFDMRAGMFIINKVFTYSEYDLDIRLSYDDERYQQLSDSPKVTELEYIYRGGKYQSSLGFMGFAEIETIDPQTGVHTLNEYSQSYPTQGSPLKTEVFSLDANNKKIILSQAEKNYQQIGSQAPYQIYANQEIEIGYKLVDNGQTQGEQTTKKTVLSEQDNFGNVTKRSEINEGFGGTISNTLVNEYGTGEMQFLGRLSQSTSNSKRIDSQAPANPASDTRTTIYSYYPTVPHRYMLESSTVVSSDPAILSVTEHYEYDIFGNQVHTYLSAGGEIRDVEAYNIYDDKGRFVEQVNQAGVEGVSKVLSRNIYDQPINSEALWDIGKPKLSSHNTYDSFGVLIKATNNLGEISYQSVALARRYSQYCPDNAVILSAKEDNTGALSMECIDTFGRTLRSISKTIDGFSYQDNQYDNRGLLIASSLPYRPSATIYWHKHRYDILGRLVQTINPDHVAGSSRNDPDALTNYSASEIIYDGNKTTAINPRGQQSTSVNNIIGEEIEVIDDNGSVLRNRYDVWGNKTHSTITSSDHSSQVLLSSEYDALGRIVRSTDPNAGTYCTSYNNFDEVIEVRDCQSNSSRITSDYDQYGRVTKVVTYKNNSQSAIDDVLTTNYLNSFSGLVKSTKRTIQEPEITEVISTPVYDDYGRNIQAIVKVDDDIYRNKTVYDDLNRVTKQYDFSDQQPLTKGLSYAYAANGSVKHLTDLYDQTIYQTITDDDAFGNVTRSTLGNGTINSRSYDPRTGRIKSQSLTNGVSSLQYKAYQWDTTGNMLSRFDFSIGQREDFSYDNLNRLTSSRIEGTDIIAAPQLPAGFPSPSTVASQQQISYDSLGNIINKSDVGRYDYDITKPHRLLSAGGNRYRYDARGNVISDGQRNYVYNAANQAVKINKGNIESRFVYNGGDILIQHDETASKSTTKLILGNVEFISGDESLIRRYYGPAVVDELSNSQRKVSYLHKDHLGSTDVITNAGGEVVQRQSFDAFGQRRDHSDWVSAPSLPISIYDDFTSKGFTGHEMLDDLGIIHMKGRIYDPVIGRFLQVDPFIQAPSLIQNYNRYSYVLNNPLAYTDPSGQMFFSLIAGIAVAAGYGSVNIYVAMAIMAFASMADALVAGAQGGQILLAGLKGAVSVYAAGLVPDVGGLGETVANQSSLFTVARFQLALMHGFTQGAIGMMGDSSAFGASFASAFISKSTGGVVKSQNVNVLSKTAISAAVSGTASVISGGKFANGAVTGAMVFLFNEVSNDPEIPQQCQASSCSTSSDTSNVGWIKATLGNAGRTTTSYSSWSEIALDYFEYMTEPFAGSGAAVAKGGSILGEGLGKGYSYFFGGKVVARGLKVTKGLETRGIKPAPGTRVRPEGVPEGWRVRPTQGKGGTEYYNPKNLNESVRIMQGNPKSPYPNSQKPYARQRDSSGSYLDANGNRGANRSSDTHIPLNQFRFRN